IQRFGAVLITTEEDGEDAYINVIGWKKEGEVEFWIYTYTINGVTKKKETEFDWLDLTGEVGTVFFDGASTIRAVLGAIAAAVVIPALALFF
ncbi:MAG: hypothetical protein EZS28_014159, partial [Streblomastix strix]